ncbi:MAG: type II CAAX endopeptidase family protein [Cyanobacteriota bacterium]|nr:type II CAAX endopeptidase family protein [Cyanobacteriota bacterium]
MRQKAVLALLLLVPINIIGLAIVVFIAPGDLFGKIFFSLCKIWMLILPAIWFFRIEKGKLNLSRPTRRETWVGLVLGVLMFAAIFGGYWLLGQQWLDPNQTRQKAQEVCLANPPAYLAYAAYFTFVNSFVEEYIWRWFVGRQCERLVSVKPAIFLSAFLFTLHHIITLAASTDLQTVILGSLGVFTAGAIWSWCYSRYRSIWSCCISHALADAAIAIVGWLIIFE